jgi:hypothetical protein
VSSMAEHFLGNIIRPLGVAYFAFHMQKAFRV